MPLPNKNKRPPSLSLRVTAFVGLTTTLCLVSLGLIVQNSIDRHFSEQDAEELQVVADSVRNMLAVSYTGQEGEDFHELLESAVVGHHGIYFRVTDSQGSSLYASQPGPDLSTLIESAQRLEVVNSNSLYSWVENEETFRGAVLNLDIPLRSSSSGASQQFMVAVGTTMEFHMAFAESFNRTLWGTIAAASLISVLAAWFAVFQGHAPLRKVSHQIRSISSDQLHLRLDADEVPAELSELVSSFNDMIGSIEDVFGRLSNFSADIAHELRTPITNLTTQTEVALGKARDVEEYREVLYSHLEEYKRMAKMVNDLLMLAKTDVGLLKPSFADLDLVAEIEELFDYFEPWAEEKKVSLKLSGSSQIIQGDQSMLRTALSNILSNAIHNTPPDKEISATLSTINQSIQISIANPGSEIPAEHLPRIFDRFYRVAPTQQGEGAGLGLAIAKSIVEIHNGKISVSSEQGVTTFLIELPG